MAASKKFTLWCLNNSNADGNVCVYQDVSNVVQSGGTGLCILAWMVAGANSGSQIRFAWNTGYQFAWFDDNAHLTQAFKPAALGDQVTLSRNQFGHQFSPSASGTDAQLTIKMDQSVPSANNIVAGIGMDGAGTFAVAARPNTVATFTPVADDALVYWISFGYHGRANQPITPANMNLPQKISFPYKVREMTAVYNVDGTWTMFHGHPSASGF
jgi:hypothetical protein